MTVTMFSPLHMQQNTTKAKPSLPQELWLRIMDCLPQQTLCALCLVSKPFLDLARRALYRSVDLTEIDEADLSDDPSDDENPNPVQKPLKPQFAIFGPVFELLQRDAGVARSVRTLCITMALACRTEHRLPVSLVLQAFENLTGLRQLTFGGGILLLKGEREAYRADTLLSGLRLHSLTVAHCGGLEKFLTRADVGSLTDHIDELLPPHDDFHRLQGLVHDVFPSGSCRSTNLSLTQTAARPDAHSFIVPLWSILAQASSSSLTRLNVSFADFANAGIVELLCNTRFTQLTTLRLVPRRDSDKDQQPLFRFLTLHSHCIEELDLDYPYSKRPLSPEDREECLGLLNPNSLTKLHTLKCPIEYMELFALAGLSSLEHTLQRVFIYIRGQDQDTHLHAMFSAMLSRFPSLKCWSKVWELDLNVSSWYEKSKVAETLEIVSQLCGSSLEIWHVAVPPLIDGSWNADQQTEEVEDMIDDPWTAVELGDLFSRFGELRILCMAGFPLPTFDGTAVDFLRETASRCPKFEACYVGEVEGRLQKYDVERKEDGGFEVVRDEVWNGELRE